jgi:hypothetical protein
VDGAPKGLVPVTPKAAWDGLPIYDILAERLSRLERVLVAHGFDDPVPRIQFHLAVLRRLRERPNVDSDEILWSLVEATELADMYCSLPTMSAKTLREKFRGILEGPVNPQRETPASTLARNTVFELDLAGWLSHRGIPARICHNPDISCEMPDRLLFIFHVSTAAFVEDVSQYRTAQLLTMCPSPKASKADRALLRHAFLRRR